MMISSRLLGAVGYKDYSLGASSTEITSILDKSGIKYEELKDQEYGEFGLKDGEFVNAEWGSSYYEYFYSQDSKYSETKKIRFTAKITHDIISFEDDNGSIILHFDLNGKLMIINVSDLKLEWDDIAKILVNKYGPATSTWKSRLTEGINYQFPKSNCEISLSQYVDGSGRSIDYINKTLLHNHNKKQYNEQKTVYDKENKEKEDKLKKIKSF